MELLPSQLIISKRANGNDTQLAQLYQHMVMNPLETFLGTYKFGAYDQLPPDNNYALVRIEDLWQEDVDSNDGGSDKDEESKMQRTQL
jgi:hypothetical protein